MTGLPSIPLPSLTSGVTAVADHIFDSTDLLATTLDDRLKSRCLAVIVLSHAEIEEAIETACSAAVRALEVNAPPGFAFLAWGLSAAKLNNPSQKDHEKQLKDGGTIRRLGSAYRDVIATSNGIKRRNIERLLLPLGIDIKPLSLDISTLNTFGEKRGAAAHLSPLKANLQTAPSIVRHEVITAANAASTIIASITLLETALAGGTPQLRRRRTIFSRFFNW